MNVIRLDRQFNNMPTLLRAFLFDQFPAIGSDSAGENGFTPFGSPDQMIHNQVNAMLVALILKSHVDIIY
jgi:hypothetical protein